jgi:hypothetical protein
MKNTLLIFLVLAGGFASAQLTLPPSGDNQHASVSQGIGLVTVTINYNSPNVHAPDGTDRKGHIWGELVHYGFIDQSFGTSKSSPWRAGSNENTTIAFSHPVRINGQAVPAGTYGLFLDVEKDGPWNWILSKNSSSWGSYYYDAKEDVLRAPTTPAEAPYTEWLTYGFEERQPTSAVAYLQWENKHIPLKIEVPDINELYYAQMSNELRGNVGFDYNNLVAAATFCAQNKIHLDQALVWAETSISAPFIGREDFSTYQAKAAVLRAMNRTADAEATMTKAINHPSASIQAIHQYGRSLLAEGQSQKAFDVFKLNRDRHPEDKFTTYVGLARGYTALGDKKNAIKNWETAIRNLPENQTGNKAAYEAELKKLKGGA